MKKFILSIFITLTTIASAFGQHVDSEESIRDRFWKNPDASFKETKVPEKWKNESAVILARRFDYEVKKLVFLTVLNENLFFHTRIKLQDQAAVNAFSEFSFNERSGSFIWGDPEVTNTYVGIKIVKEDGREIEVSLDEAVLKELKDGSVDESYKKIAIPDLQPGDILDYYYGSKKEILNSYFKAFEVNRFPLASEYPILKQKVSINVMRKCHLSAKSLNGCGALKSVPTKKKNTSLYILEDANREKLKKHQWLYSQRSLPMLKFQAFFASKPGLKGYSNYATFMSEQGQVRDFISKDEVLEYINELVNVKPPENTFAFLKKNFKKEKDPEVIVKEAYYCLRNIFFRQGYESYNLEEKDDDYVYKPITITFGNQTQNKGKVTFGVSSRRFMRLMSGILNHYEIDYDVLFTSPRVFSDLDNLFLYQESRSLIKVNTAKPFYICNPGRYSNFKDIDSDFQGNEAYSVNISKKKKDRTTRIVKIPMVDADTNKAIETMKGEIDLQNEQLKLTVSNIISGALKDQHLWNVLTPYDYIYASKNDKYDNYLLESGKSEELLDRIKQKQQQFKDERTERVSAMIKADFDLEEDVEIDQFKLGQIGMWDDASTLEYSFSFSTEELLTKTGNNYLLEVGKLISSQVDIEEDEKERDLDIFMPFARTFENKIELTIPDGYTAKGIEALNMNVTNEKGKFVSTVTLQGNQLIIHTIKTYNSNHYKSDEWADIVNFLDAAYDFSNKKLLILKI